MTVQLPSPTETGIPVTQAVRQMAAGATNARGTLTLAPGATVTVVDDELSADGIAVFLSPRTANAAAAGAWHSASAKGQFTISHPAAAAGCIFDYLIQR